MTANPERDSYLAAATETERMVAEIWSELLGLPRVSVLANFFDLGGHSVLIHMVHDQLAQRLATAPPVVELFKYPTIRALARYLDGSPDDHDQGKARGVSGRGRARARMGSQRDRRRRSAGPGAAGQ